MWKYAHYDCNTIDYECLKTFGMIVEMEISFRHQFDKLIRRISFNRIIIVNQYPR